MSLTNPLARVLGRGSARSGTEHWWMQRLTAIALLPLTIWIVFVIARYGAAPHAEVVSFMQSPLVAALLLAWVFALLHHAQLGVQVIIEDYIHTPWMEYTALIGIKLLAALGAIIAAISVLKVVTAGA